MTTLIIAEHDNAVLKAATLNTIAAGTRIGGDIHVLVAGCNCAAVAQTAAAVAGVSKVLHVDAAHLEAHLAENLAETPAESVAETLEAGVELAHLEPSLGVAGEDVGDRRGRARRVVRIEEPAPVGGEALRGRLRIRGRFQKRFRGRLHFSREPAQPLAASYSSLTLFQFTTDQKALR